MPGDPGRILSTAGDTPLTRTGRVDFSGIVKEINLAFVPEAGIGDYVLVHVGFALARIDEAEAARVFDLSAADGRALELEGRARPMRYVDEYRDAAPPELPRRSRARDRPWTIMEVCGGQTHAIVRYGVDELLPPDINSSTVRAARSA